MTCSLLRGHSPPNLVWMARLADRDAKDSGKFFDRFDHQPFAESVKLARDFLDRANSRPVQASRLLGPIRAKNGGPTLHYELCSFGAC